MMEMENIARRCDMKNETDPDTPNPPKTSSFSIHSVVGKGVFFAANVAMRVVVVVVIGAAAVVTTLVVAGAVVVGFAGVFVWLGLAVLLAKLNRYFSAAFIIW